jgi:hypothetical protein
MNRTIERLRAEFIEMPGLRLTAKQVQRLCAVEETLCQAVLDALVDARFLCLTDGTYRRASDGAARPLKAQTAQLRPRSHAAAADS